MPLRVIKVDSRSIGHGIQFRWSSIFTGAFLSLGFGLAFVLLGNAIGLSISNVANATIGSALRFWSWVYMAATLIFSFWAGSYLATRSNEIVSSGAGMLHGAACWALCSTFTSVVAIMISPVARSVVTGTGPNSVNWLAICVLGLGLPASIMGGMLGKSAVRYTRVTEEEGGERFGVPSGRVAA